MGRISGNDEDLLHALIDHSVWADLAEEFGTDAVDRLRHSLAPSSGRQKSKGATGKGSAAGTRAKGSARYTLYTDGGSSGNPGPSGGGGIVLDESGTEIDSFSEYFGEATNNVAEYRALLAGIDRCILLKCTHVDIRMDSELLVKQILGTYRVKSPHLKPLHQAVKKKLSGLRFTVSHVPREQNQRADHLAGQAISRRR